MMRVFGIGLSRTGTTSLNEMMRRLGFSAVHMPTSWQEIEAHQFCNDTPISARFEELDRRYPGSLFIYTRRPQQAWLASIRRWLSLSGRMDWYLQFDQRQRDWIDESDHLVYGCDYSGLPVLSDEAFAAVWAAHEARVMEYFRQRPDDLLVIDLTAPAAHPYTALVQFLERRGALETPRLNPGPAEVGQTALNQLDLEIRQANAWRKLGRIERAITGYRRVLAAEPRQLEVLKALGSILLEQELYDEALRLAEKGLAHFPGSSELHKVFSTALVATQGIQAAFARYGLQQVDERPARPAPGEILCCLVTRNEYPRLPTYLAYYRALGVERFFVVDNGSEDGTLEYLLEQPDVHVWRSDFPFGSANFGAAWFDLLLRRYGVGHWTLMMDADELLVYAGCESYPLRALCADLDAQGKQALGGMLLDMYADRPVAQTVYNPGESFIETCPFFDRQAYHTEFRNGGPYHNQTTRFGGVRQRVFGEATKVYLNKVPLLYYQPERILAGGQHWTDLPASQIVDQGAVVLHFKFFASFSNYVRQEVARGQHYGNAQQYRQYAAVLEHAPDLILYSAQHSERYTGSEQLLRLGLLQALARQGRRPAHAPAVEALETGQRPFWSVLLTVYERVPLLEQALMSVLTQAAPPEEMEIIVLQDGGVSAATRQDAAALVARIGQGRVRFHGLAENLGHPEIFNECIRQARGRFLHILHDDNLALPGFYAALRPGLEAGTAGAAFCRYRYRTSEPGAEKTWDVRLEQPEPGLLDDWLPRIATLCRQIFAATVVARTTYEAIGGFSAAAGSAFDWEMWQRIAAYYPVWYEPRILAVSTSDGSSLTGGLSARGQNVIDSLAAIELAQTYLPPAVAAAVHNRARRRYARHALWVARESIHKGEYRSALANLRAALRADPSIETLDELTRALDEWKP